MAINENKNYFIANFFGDNESVLRVVSRTWILDHKLSYPFISYTYYSSDSVDSVVLPSHLLRQFVSDTFLDKIDGCVYKAEIMIGFGKQILLIFNV